MSGFGGQRPDYPDHFSPGGSTMRKLFVPEDTGDRYLLAALRDRARAAGPGTESGSFLTATVADGSARDRRDRRIAARAAATAAATPVPAPAPRPALPAVPVLLVPSRRIPPRPTPFRPGLVPLFRAA